MADKTRIEWTDHTFNPWWGCQKVSPGCEHCYAETLSNRFGKNIWGPPHATDRRTFGDNHWREPIGWNARAEREGRRSRVFCASMADVFEDHPDVDVERSRLWDLIQITPYLDWQLLTKRPENVRAMTPASWWTDGFPANVWLGTSVEDQERAEERIPALLDIPAAVRFLSCEPLLGPVNIARYVPRAEIIGDDGIVHYRVPVDHPILVEQLPRLQKLRPGTGYHSRPEVEPDPFLHPGPFVSWVIVGGESGPGARPMHPDWARSLRDQCTAAGVAFLMKQWGAWAPSDQCGVRNYKQSKNRFAYESDRFQPDGTRYEPAGTQPPTDAGGYAAPGMETLIRVGKKKAGRELDGRTWDEMPAAPMGVPA